MEPTTAWVTSLLKLLNRGATFETDTVAALVCAGLAEGQAQQMLDAAKRGDGMLDGSGFKELMTECIAGLTAGEADPAAVERLVTALLLGMFKDFEKRATARGSFMVAAEARHHARRLRQSAEARQHEHMSARQTRQKSEVQEAHVMEAVEFNRAWSTNMEEFEHRASQIVQARPPARRATLPSPSAG